MSQDTCPARWSRLRANPFRGRVTRRCVSTSEYRREEPAASTSLRKVWCRWKGKLAEICGKARCLGGDRAAGYGQNSCGPDVVRLRREDNFGVRIATREGILEGALAPSLFRLDPFGLAPQSRKVFWPQAEERTQNLPGRGLGEVLGRGGVDARGEHRLGLDIEIALTNEIIRKMQAAAHSKFLPRDANTEHGSVPQVRGHALKRGVTGVGLAWPGTLSCEDFVEQAHARYVLGLPLSRPRADGFGSLVESLEESLAPSEMVPLPLKGIVGNWPESPALTTE